MPIYALGSERARIHPSAFVHPDAVLIGEVHLGAESSVWPSAVIRADNGPIYVIAHLAHLEGCVIEDVVLVGTGAIVLENAVCRTVSFIAAGAVVRPGMEVP